MKRQIYSSHLLRGLSTSCGCKRAELCRKLHKKHGETNSREYETWIRMKQRCENKNNKVYKSYGGRGIKICKRWSSRFENFLHDMGKRPSDNHSIDRINNNGDYKPSNCRWATRKVQLRNKRNNKIIEINGEKMPLVTAVEIYGGDYHSIKWKLNNGRTVKEAFSL